MERVENLFDKPEEREPEDRDEAEDFAASYSDRIKRLPKLSAAEEGELLERWVKFRDQKARDKVIEGRLREVEPMAKNTARKFGFEPGMSATKDAWTGFKGVISDLTAAGNLGLVNALEHYSLDRPFENYFRSCISNEIVRQAKQLRSVVHRPYGKPAPWDLSADPTMPDLMDTRDYCGSRANPSVRDDPEDDLDDDGPQVASHTRLRPPPEPPIIERWRRALTVMDLEELTRDERRVIRARMRGLTLQEIADELNMSVATAWRREKQAVNKLAEVST